MAEQDNDSTDLIIDRDASHGAVHAENLRKFFSNEEFLEFAKENDPIFAENNDNFSLAVLVGIFLAIFNSEIMVPEFDSKNRIVDLTKGTVKGEYDVAIRTLAVYYSEMTGEAIPGENDDDKKAIFHDDCSEWIDKMLESTLPEMEKEILTEKQFEGIAEFSGYEPSSILGKEHGIGLNTLQDIGVSEQELMYNLNAFENNANGRGQGNFSAQKGINAINSFANKNDRGRG